MPHVQLQLEETFRGRLWEVVQKKEDYSTNQNVTVERIPPPLWKHDRFLSSRFIQIPWDIYEIVEKINLLLSR